MKTSVRRTPLPAITDMPLEGKHHHPQHSQTCSQSHCSIYSQLSHVVGARFQIRYSHIQVRYSLSMSDVQVRYSLSWSHVQVRYSLSWSHVQVRYSLSRSHVQVRYSLSRSHVQVRYSLSWSHVQVRYSLSRSHVQVRYSLSRSDVQVRYSLSWSHVQVRYSCGQTPMSDTHASISHTQESVLTCCCSRGGPYQGQPLKVRHAGQYSRVAVAGVVHIKVSHSRSDTQVSTHVLL